MRTVLVTGAGGFIGSHLCERLVREGWNVRAFVRYTSHDQAGALDASRPETFDRNSRSSPATFATDPRSEAR